jgi:hypothetical protein
MSSDDSKALERFIAQLKQAWRAAGQPSYGELEALSAQLVLGNHGREVKLGVLSHSTTQQILAGKRLSAPKWPWVLSYVTVLQAAARKAGIPPESIGTIDEWKRWHEAACGAESVGRGRVSAEGRRGSIGSDSHGGGPRVSVVLPPGDWAASEEEDARLGMFLGLIRRAGAPQWWDDYGDVTPEWLAYYLYLESIATRIRMYAPGLIPCLLQTEAYAHAVVSRNYPEASADQVDRLVELRLRRQERLQGPEACQLWAVVEEDALRDERVSRQTMRGQLSHLINIAVQRNVAISVLPSSRRDDNGAISEGCGSSGVTLCGEFRVVRDLVSGSPVSVRV